MQDAFPADRLQELDRRLRAMAAAPVGSRSYMPIRVSRGVGQMPHSNLLNAVTVLPVLKEAGRRVGLAGAEASRTAVSGLRSGSKR